MVNFYPFHLFLLLYSSVWCFDTPPNLSTRVNLSPRHLSLMTPTAHPRVYSMRGMFYAHDNLARASGNWETDGGIAPHTWWSQPRIWRSLAIIINKLSTYVKDTLLMILIFVALLLAWINMVNVSQWIRLKWSVTVQYINLYMMQESVINVWLILRRRMLGILLTMANVPLAASSLNLVIKPIVWS